MLDTGRVEVEEILAGAHRAGADIASQNPVDRARLLDTLADALAAQCEQLISLAAEETALPEPRLRSELVRTTEQLRLFASTLEDGSYLEAVIDLADPKAVPAARPDLRRMLVPIGPVLVFAASNFPFAFSVAGGDTASALAAGCPVVVKAHPGHPRLSERVGEILGDATDSIEGPERLVTVVHGLEAGKSALLDARIRAAAFTGSLAAGRALFDLANQRSDPIPFYGELGSLNPVFVSSAVVRRRGAEIVQGFVSSFTLGLGQFCTKPGLLFLPAGHDLEGRLVEATRAVPPGRMLTDRLRAAFAEDVARVAGHERVRVVAAPGRQGDGQAPTLLATTVSDLVEAGDELLTECFGPMSLIVEYEDDRDLLTATHAIEGSLAAAVFAEDDEADLMRPLVELLRDRVGRVVWNNWPTGVAVTEAMHHGGPWPATTSSIHTSVGPTGIRRFLRPVCYQSVPQALLPPALRDRNVLGIPRRVSGQLTRSGVTAP